MWHHHSGDGWGLMIRAAALGSGLVWAFGRDIMGRGWLALRDPDLICWAALPANDSRQAASLALSLEASPRAGLRRQAGLQIPLPRLDWCDSCPWFNSCSASNKKAPSP